MFKSFEALLRLRSIRTRTSYLYKYAYINEALFLSVSITMSSGKRRAIGMQAARAQGQLPHAPHHHFLVGNRRAA